MNYKFDSESIVQCSTELDKLLDRLAVQYHIPNCAMIGILELAKYRLAIDVNEIDDEE